MSAPTGFTPNIVNVGYGLDKGWIMTSAGFVLLMQIGLGLLEIGSIRRKNSRIVWHKILLNIINAFWWWFILGFAWAFGETNGSFLGAETFYAGGHFDQPFYQAINAAAINTSTQELGPGYSAQWAHFVWRVAEALVATTIATGILTERITMRGVFVFNLAFNMIILPFIFAWTFAFGFLVDDIGYRDYAGCFIIFGVGAFAGLAGLLLIKPRYNRYQKFPVVLLAGPGVVGGPIVGDARPISAGQGNLPSVAFDKFNQPTTGAYAPTTSGVAAPGASATAFSIDNVVRVRARLNEDVYEHFGVTDFGLVNLGAIIFFIGFLFFCGGAAQGLQSSLLYTFAETSFANAAVAGPAAGLVTALFLAIFVRRRPARENFATVARAFVAGCVCVAADPAVYKLWAGFVIGMIGALSYLIMSYWFFHMRLDDPAEFFPMFGAPAISGLICSAFFNRVNGIWYTNAPEGEVLIWQLLGMAILAGWTFAIALITFGILRLFKALRIGLKTEIIGYDYIDGGRHLDYPDKGIETLEKERVK